MDGSDLGGFVPSERPTCVPDTAWERIVKACPVLSSKGYQAAIRECDYVVERRPGSWFWKRWQVRPAKATGEYSAVFKGTHYDCLVVAQQLRCAVANGAWVALSPEYH